MGGHPVLNKPKERRAKPLNIVGWGGGGGGGGAGGEPLKKSSRGGGRAGGGGGGDPLKNSCGVESDKKIMKPLGEEHEIQEHLART